MSVVEEGGLVASDEPITRADLLAAHVETRAVLTEVARLASSDNTVAAMEALDLRDEVAAVRDSLPVGTGVFDEVVETLAKVEQFLTSRVAVWGARATGGMLAFGAVVKFVIPALSALGADGASDAIAALDLS